MRLDRGKSLVRPVTFWGIALIACGMRLTIPPAWADDCATIMDAMKKQATTPYATVMVTAQPGEPEQRNEVVVTGGKMYVQVNGTWQSIPYDAQETIKMTDEQVKKAKTRSCTKSGSETIAGQAATIYSETGEDRGKTGGGRIWISDKTGLPLKVEMQTEGLRVTQTSRYDNITAPPNAR